MRMSVYVFFTNLLIRVFNIVNMLYRVQLLLNERQFLSVVFN